MARMLVALCVAVAVATAGILGHAQAPQQFPVSPTPQHPMFRAGATLVAVDVYATRNGAIVDDLTPADFEVKEDGKPQTVEFFEVLKFPLNVADSARRDPASADEGERLAGDPHHRAFVAYFDLFHLFTAGARNMREPVIEFLNRTIGPTDYFAALNSETPLSALTFGQRTDTITAEIDRYWPLSAVAETESLPLTAHEKWLQRCYYSRDKRLPIDEELLATLFGRWRVDAVFSSLTALTAKLASIREERTNVLLFADGWHLIGPDDSLMQYAWSSPGGLARAQGTPTAVPPDPRACDNELQRLAELDLGSTFHQLVNDARRANVVFFPVEPDGLAVFGEHLTNDVPPLGSLSPPPPRPWAVVDGDLEPLREAALKTNGQSIVRTNDIRTPLLALADTFASYYLLGYYTTNTTQDGKFRTIDVKVRTPGVKVTARPGYVATPVVAPAPTPSPPAPSTEDRSAFEDLARFDAAEPVSVRAVAVPGHVLIVAQVGDAEAGSVKNGADVRVSLTSATAPAPLAAVGQIAPGARSTLVDVAVGAGAGPWQVTATVGGPDGNLTGRVGVAAVASTLVSAPVFYRATPSLRSPLWPVAAPFFSRTDRLHLEWMTTGPLDNRVARLLDRRGQPVAVGVTVAEPPSVNGVSKLVGDINLAPLGAGDYLVELVVGRGGTTERHLVAFRVGS